MGPITRRNPMTKAEREHILLEARKLIIRVDQAHKAAANSTLHFGTREETTQHG